MEYGLYDFLRLIGALGFFIYGMKVMSESIQKVAGEKLRDVMSLITSNRVSGVFTGFLTTAVIQSSSATTVMVVSFVNAGLLKLREAISVIMGANIGTTVTAILILFLGFSKFSISHYTLPIIAFGFPMLFSKRVDLKYWGEFLIGFALLFMGLSELKNAVPDLKGNPEVLEWITSVNELGFLSIIIAVLIGTVLTVVVQSSSAAMAITLIMCDNGWIPFDMAAGIVLGENIGTTITANLASLVANVHAKRAARAHLLFNALGVVWMLIVFSFYIGAIDSLMVSTGHGSPLNETEVVKWGLTYFHISFNIINTLLMIWFVPQIEKFVVKLVKVRDDEDTEFSLQYIGTNLMMTAELSLAEVRKEMVLFGGLVKKMNGFLINLVQTDSQKKIEKLLKKIDKYEDRTDELEIEIGDYLVKVSEDRLSHENSEEIRSTFSIAGDLERAADIIYRMSKDASKKSDLLKTNLTSKQHTHLKELMDLVSESIEVMLDNLSKDYSDVSLEEAQIIESKINEKTKELNKIHFKNIENKGYDYKTGVVYRDLIFSCEKIGDHVINVTESLAALK